MSQIQTASRRMIPYSETGTGHPVLFIPGRSGYRLGCFTWLADDLAAHFRIISMDNRDAGDCDPETEYYDLTDMTRDAVELLDALNLRRTHLLGHSMGGKIALRFALDFPERVNRLVLIGSSLTGGEGHRAGEPVPEPEDWWVDDPVERFRGAIPFIVGSAYRATLDEATVNLIAELERGNRATWPGGMRQEAAVRPHDLTDALPRIQAPTLVIHGDDDEPNHGPALAAGIPNARLLALEGVGHLPWVERPDLAAPAIIDFLQNGGGTDEMT